MIITIAMTLITGYLMGYYGYKTITSGGMKIGGWPMIIMKVTPFVFLATFIVGFVNIGWKAIFIFPFLYIIGMPTKSLLLKIKGNK